MIAPAQATSLLAALTMLEISLSELWMSYLGLGGDLPVSEIEDFLEGRVALTEGDYDRLVQVANEEFMDRGEGHPVPYADDAHI